MPRFRYIRSKDGVRIWAFLKVKYIAITAKGSYLKRCSTTKSPLRSYRKIVAEILTLALDNEMSALPVYLSSYSR
jgi:hypothetical protein